MFNSFWKSVVGDSNKDSSSNKKPSTSSSQIHQDNAAKSNNDNNNTNQQETNSRSQQQPTSFFERFERFAQSLDLDDGNNNTSSSSGGEGTTATTSQQPSYNNNNNNNARRVIPDELREIDREWSAITRYFDAAIIGELDETATSESMKELNFALSSQLSELDSKLKRIVALVYCGGRLPSAFAKTLETGAVVRWEKVPNPTNNRTEKALRSCRKEGVSIFAVACQLAKQNLPPGSRSVLSSFMLEMLAMMEVSSNWITTDDDDQQQQQDKDKDKDKDNKRREHTIGDVLVENRHTVCEPLVNFIAKTIREVIRNMQFNNHEEEKNEKLYFARLIRYLCESVSHQGERLLAVPDNINNNSDDEDDLDKLRNQKNIIISSSSNKNNNNSSAPSNKALADAGQLSLPWLLDVVTMFSRADDLFPVAPLALDHALRAHLSLAVSQFDIVGSSSSSSTSSSSSSSSLLFDALLSHLGFTFVTLCRLEENQEFYQHLSIVSTTMKYLDSMFIFAPHVVDATDLPAKFFKFLLGTVIEMVKLPSDRSYMVSMLVLTEMMENWSNSVPGQSPIPTLIAQSVLCHSMEVTEAFFSRLSDISVKVRSAAGNFLVAAMRTCPMLFVSVIAKGIGSITNSNNNNNNNNNSSSSVSAAAPVSSDTIGDLFPSITNMLIHDDATMKNCGLQFEHARSKIIFNETRSGEQAPGLMIYEENEEDEDEKEFKKICEYFVRTLRRSLSYDLQQYTTYDSSHCAVLSGLIIELLSLPSSSTLSSSSSLFINNILRESLPSISQHVTARLGRIEDKIRNSIEDIVQHSAGSATSDHALLLVRQKVPDEFKAFARGAVHLAHLRLEVWSILRAKEEQQRLREIDPDE